MLYKNHAQFSLRTLLIRDQINQLSVWADNAGVDKTSLAYQQTIEYIRINPHGVYGPSDYQALLKSFNAFFQAKQGR